MRKLPLEKQSCSVMYGQHFAEKDERKQNFLGCTSVDKDLDIKDIPEVQTLGQMHQ